jgi:hypothetical protein
VRALVNCSVFEFAIAPELLVVTISKCSIDRITKPDHFYSHSVHVTLSSRMLHEVVWWNFADDSGNIVTQKLREMNARLHGVTSIVAMERPSNRTFCNSFDVVNI